MARPGGQDVISFDLSSTKCLQNHNQHCLLEKHVRNSFIPNQDVTDDREGGCWPMGKSKDGVRNESDGG